MKSILRKITVCGQSFVYWFWSGEKFHLFISPKEDKNTKLELIFAPDIVPEDPASQLHLLWTFYELTGYKNNSKTTICLANPGGVAEILSYLLKHQEDLFQGEHTCTIYNAFDLLYRMGYTNLEVKWISEW